MILISAEGKADAKDVSSLIAAVSNIVGHCYPAAYPAVDKLQRLAACVSEQALALDRDAVSVAAVAKAVAVIVEAVDPSMASKANRVGELAK